MYRALIEMRDGEGNLRYAPAPGEENLHHVAPEQAAEHILSNHGKGLITTQEGEYVAHV